MSSLKRLGDLVEKYQESQRDYAISQQNRDSGNLPMNSLDAIPAKDNPSDEQWGMKQNLLDPSLNNSEALRNHFNSIWEEAYNNDFLHQRENLARTERGYNVSDMTPEETLRNSRLADALNNRYYRSGQHINSMMATEGGGESGSLANYGSLYQMPIETEEMRQQQRNRQYEALAQGRRINRQQDMTDMQLEHERDEYQRYLKNILHLDDEQIRRYMDRYDYNVEWYRKNRDQQFERAFMAYQRIGIPTEQANLLWRVSGGNNTRLQYFAYLMGISAGGPTPMQFISNNRQQEVLQRAERENWDSKKTGEELTKEMTSAVYESAAASLNVTTEQLKNALGIER